MFFSDVAESLKKRGFVPSNGEDDFEKFLISSHIDEAQWILDEISSETRADSKFPLIYSSKKFSREHQKTSTIKGNVSKLGMHIDVPGTKDDKEFDIDKEFKLNGNDVPENIDESIAQIMSIAA